MGDKMITEELINYLNDYTVSSNEKFATIRDMNLSFSNMIELMGMFKGRGPYQVLHSVFMANNHNLCMTMDEQVKGA